MFDLKKIQLASKGTGKSVFGTMGIFSGEAAVIYGNGYEGKVVCSQLSTEMVLLSIKFCAPDNISQKQMTSFGGK